MFDKTDDDNDDVYDVMIIGDDDIRSWILGGFYIPMFLNVYVLCFSRMPLLSSLPAVNDALGSIPYVV